MGYVPLLMDFGLYDGILTPARRALESRIAVFCFWARAAPNLRRVELTIAGGFVFSSWPMDSRVLSLSATMARDLLHVLGEDGFLLLQAPFFLGGGDVL